MEPALGFGDDQPFRRQSRQRLAYSAQAQLSLLGEQIDLQLRARSKPAGEDIPAQLLVNTLGKGLTFGDPIGYRPRCRKDSFRSILDMDL